MADSQVSNNNFSKQDVRKTSLVNSHITLTPMTVLKNKNIYLQLLPYDLDLFLECVKSVYANNF